MTKEHICLKEYTGGGKLKDKILNLMLEGYYLIDSKGNIVDVNDSYCKMSGYSKDELLKMNIRELDVYQEERDIKITMKKIIENGHFIFETKHKKKNGEIFLVETSVSILTDDEEMFFIAIMRDVTEQRKIDMRIEETNKILTEIIKHAPIHTFVKEIIDGHSVVIYASENYVNMIGIKGSDMVGKNMYELFPEEFAKNFTEDDIEVVKKMKTLNLREDFKNKNYITIKSPIIISDRKLLIGYTVEITELISAKNEAEKASNIKTTFLANVSHEMRTPLNGIIGFIDLISEDVKEDKQEYVEIIKKSSKNLLKIINDMLRISRLNKGEYFNCEEKFNLYDTTENIIKIYQQEAKDKGIDFIFEFDNNLKIELILNKNMYLHVLNNLFSNAVKFTNKGIIKTVFYKVEENLFEILILDTGIGIKKSKMDKIFDIFEQSEHFLTKKYSGIGLGLSIVKEIIELLKGEIVINSEEGVGTEIRIKLKMGR